MVGAVQGASQARGHGGKLPTTRALQRRAVEQKGRTYGISGACVGLDRDHELAGIVGAGFLCSGHGVVGGGLVGDGALLGRWW